jgi:iron uptake system EfeUOB component EfeO/EfeM
VASAIAVLGLAVIALLAAALRPTGDGGHGRVAAPAPGLGIAPPATTGRAPSGERAVAGSSESARQAAADATGVTLVGPPSEVVPLSPHAFATPIARYRAYAAGQARAMGRATTALLAALRRDDRGAARAAWGEAYERFARIGAAYGALGALGSAIDARSGSLPGGVHDRAFGGLHAVERGLWTGAPARALVPVAARLVADVRRLPRRLRTMDIAPLDFTLRAHEILEDAQRDELGGAAAPWSGAGVRATAGAYAATRAVLRTLSPLLNGRGDVLPPVRTSMAVLGQRLAAIRRAHGGRWPPVQRLGRGDRERLDGALGNTLEALAGVPGDLETVRPKPYPPIARRLG